MVKLEFDVAVCAVGVVESVTVIATEAVPTTFEVPVTAPVELLIDRPEGRLFALKV
jgi:hypothetical protein